MSRLNRTSPLPVMLTTATILALWTGCAPLATSPDAELVVSIDQPANGFTEVEGNEITFEATSALDTDIPPTELFDLHDICVLWTSDVVGALTGMEGEGASLACQAGSGDSSTVSWLSGAVEINPAQASAGFKLKTTLPPGSHVITARAMDVMGGRALPGSASMVVAVTEISAPELHVVAPADLDEFTPPEDFTIEAWVSNPRGGEVETSWASSVEGFIDAASQTLNADEPGVVSVPCHAGSKPPDLDPTDPNQHCYLKPGTHVMTFTARERLPGDGGDSEGIYGGTSHAFVTLRIGQFDDDEEE